jgi:hypothetical protein
LLPLAKQQEPVRAWKYAVLLYDAQQPFCGIGFGGSYSSVSVSGHFYNEDLGPPVYGTYSDISDEPAEHIRRCDCGFHGLMAPPATDDDERLWLLEVELYGTVIECEFGYRATKQRVISVIPPYCCRYHPVADNLMVTSRKLVLPDCDYHKLGLFMRRQCGSFLKSVNVDDIRSLLRGIEVQLHRPNMKGKT